MWHFFSWPTQFQVLWSALQLWQKLYFETNFVWAHVVQVHKVKKKSFYIMSVLFWLLSRVFEVTTKNITFVIEKDFFSCYHLHMLLAFCKYIHMWLAKATPKDQFKPTFLVFEKTTFVISLHVMWRCHKSHIWRWSRLQDWCISLCDSKISNMLAHSTWQFRTIV